MRSAERPSRAAALRLALAPRLGPLLEAHLSTSPPRAGGIAIGCSRARAGTSAARSRASPVFSGGVRAVGVAPDEYTT